MAAIARGRSRPSLPSSTAIFRQAMANEVSSVTASPNSASPRSISPASSARCGALDVLPQRRERRRGDPLQLGARADRAKRFARLLPHVAGELAQRADQPVLVRRCLPERGELLPVQRRHQPRRHDVALPQADDLAVEHRLGALPGRDLPRQLERHGALRRPPHQAEDVAHRGTGQDVERAGLGQVGAERLGDRGAERGIAGRRAEVGDDDGLPLAERALAPERGRGPDAERPRHHEADDEHGERAHRRRAAEPGPAPGDVRARLERERGERARRGGRAARA